MTLPEPQNPHTSALVKGHFRSLVADMPDDEAVDYLLDLLDYLIQPEDQDISPLRERYGFTIIEAKLVLALLRANERCLSKDTLMGLIYGAEPENDWPQTKIIDVFVCKVRRKLNADKAPFQIETVWGQGYRAVLDSSEVAHGKNSPARPGPVDR